MSNIFEIIEAIMVHKGYSLRDMADKMDMPYTTVASIMTRRSSKISRHSVEAFAKALEVDFYDLMPREADKQAITTLNGIRYPSDCSEEFMRSTLLHIIGDDYIQYIPENNQQRIKKVALRKADLKGASSSDERILFKQSIDFVLNKLNDDGLMEAMRRVLEVAQDSRYCLHNSTNDLVSKQDDLA